MTERAVPNLDPFSRAAEHARSHGVQPIHADLERPWGGFFVFDSDHVDAFADAFLPDLVLPDPLGRPAMSPKLLVVAPRSRLSWQYHHRRAEVWSVVEGPVAMACGPNDDQPEPTELATGELVRHAAGTRHRLIGLDGWGIVAEIWEHTDAELHSDEDDIVRLQDDYGR